MNLQKGSTRQGNTPTHHILELPWGVRAEEVRAKGVLAGGLPLHYFWSYRVGSTRQGSTSPEDTPPIICGATVVSTCKGSARTHQLVDLQQGVLVRGVLAGGILPPII